MNFFEAIALAGAAAIAMLAAGPAQAQRDVDRADPAIAERQLSAPAPAESPADAAPRAPATALVAPPAITSPFRGPVSVGAVVVDGARLVRAAEFAPAIAPYLGRRLDERDLGALAGAVADLARARGYVFATAYVPPQPVASGVLRVRLDEGRIDAVRVTGTPNPAIDRALAGLADGRPATRRALERALLLAEDLPGVRIAGSTFRREGARGVLVVRTRSEPVAASVQIDNWGSSSVGPVRVRVRADANGVLLAGDQLSLRGTATPISPRELATVGFDYAMDTGLGGLLAGVGASYTRVRPGGSTRASDIDGRSASFNAGLSYPVVRTLDADVRATADLTVRDVEQDRVGRPIRADRLTTVTLGVSAYRTLFGGWAYARLDARRGLDAFDATKRGDPLASRRGAGAVFGKLDLYADWTGPVAGPVSMRVAGEAQVATRALLSSEEMGIGGPRFGRAYDYSELSGDRGIAGLMELRYDVKGAPIKGRTTQVYAFADAGSVGNKGRGGRGGKLYSAGFGARVDVSRAFDVGIEAGLPLGRDRFESGNRSPRLSWTLSGRF